MERPFVTIKYNCRETEVQSREGTLPWSHSKLVFGLLVQDPFPSFPCPQVPQKQCETFSKHLLYAEHKTKFSPTLWLLWVGVLLPFRLKSDWV